MYTNLHWFTANCCYKLQVYSTLNTLQLWLASHWPISELLHFCTLVHVNQWTITLLYCWQSVFKHFFTVAQPINELLHLFGLFTMLQHYLAFIALLLVELITMDCDIVIWLSYHNLAFVYMIFGFCLYEIWQQHKSTESSEVAFE